MNRVKPYKIFLVLAVMIAGIICLLLPEKKVIPVASMEDAVKNINTNTGTLQNENIDTVIVYKD